MIATLDARVYRHILSSIAYEDTEDAASWDGDGKQQ